MACGVYNRAIMSENYERRLTWSERLAHLAPAKGSEARDTLPFLLIVTVALVAMYGVALSSNSDLRELPALLLFTSLMALYLASFLALLAIQGRQANPRWMIAMLAGQIVLALAISMMAQNMVVSFGVFAPLIGLTVGAVRNRLAAAAAVLIMLGLSMASGIRVDGVDAVLGWLIFAIPLTLFVVVYVLLFTRQAEARAEAQRLLGELEIAHQQLAEYAVEVEDLTLAAERQRMARELHDTLAQGLAGLILQLEAARSQLDQGRPGRSGEIVDQAMARARATLHEARQAIGDLRTPQDAVEDLGLAIRRETERFSRATGIPCAVEIALDAPLPQRTNEHAVRIVAEALSNVAQHAEAGQVWVSAVSGAGAVEIAVRDDGVGFDATANGSQAGHYGLVGMRERARLASGALEVASAPGQGTVVRLFLATHGHRSL